MGGLTENEHNFLQLADGVLNLEPYLRSNAEFQFHFTRSGQTAMGCLIIAYIANSSIATKLPRHVDRLVNRKTLFQGLYLTLSESK